jgi:hypothetical protein
VDVTVNKATNFAKDSVAMSMERQDQETTTVGMTTGGDVQELVILGTLAKEQVANREINKTLTVTGVLIVQASDPATTTAKAGLRGMDPMPVTRKEPTRDQATIHALIQEHPVARELREMATGPSAESFPFLHLLLVLLLHLLNPVLEREREKAKAKKRVKETKTRCGRTRTGKSGQNSQSALASWSALGPIADSFTSPTLMLLLALWSTMLLLPLPCLLRRQKNLGELSDVAIIALRRRDRDHRGMIAVPASVAVIAVPREDVVARVAEAAESEKLLRRPLGCP